MRTPDPNSGNVLIVGGRGQVGHAVADRLAPLYPNRVLVAGRDQDKATSAANRIGQGAQGRAIDIATPDTASISSALDGVTLAIACLDQTGIGFVEQCLSRGVHYIDISADDTYLARIEALNQVAVDHNATAVLSVGVAPGLTNVLATRAIETMVSTDRLDIVLEFGLGDQHGRAALEWMLNQLDATYDVTENGQLRTVRSFGEHIAIRLPGQRSDRAAYRFNFADQHVLRRTLDIPTISTWVRYDNRLVTWLFAAAARAGLGRLLRRPRWRAAALRLMGSLHVGPDTCGVAVRATGRAVAGGTTRTVGLLGRQEALMTAIVTAETARQILARNPRPGIHHSHQIVDLDSVMAALSAEQPYLITTL